MSDSRPAATLRVYARQSALDRPDRAGPGDPRVAGRRRSAPPRNPPAAGARLAGRGAAVRNAHHTHAPEAQAELLAPVGRADVEPGQLAHAFQAVTHRVAVRVQALRRAGDVAVRIEERLDRLHEVGLVLVVVRDERLDGLGVEALQLAGVLAHGRQQQPVSARLLEREDGAIGVALRDV